MIFSRNLPLLTRNFLKDEKILYEKGDSIKVVFSTSYEKLENNENRESKYLHPTLNLFIAFFTWFHYL